jgi:hypothetical protein
MEDGSLSGPINGSRHAQSLKYTIRRAERIEFSLNFTVLE